MPVVKRPKSRDYRFCDLKSGAILPQAWVLFANEKGECPFQLMANYCSLRPVDPLYITPNNQYLDLHEGLLVDPVVLAYLKTPTYSNGYYYGYFRDISFLNSPKQYCLGKVWNQPLWLELVYKNHVQAFYQRDTQMAILLGQPLSTPKPFLPLEEVIKLYRREACKSH